MAIQASARSATALTWKTAPTHVSIRTRAMTVIMQETLCRDHKEVVKASSAAGAQCSRRLSQRILCIIKYYTNRLAC